MLQLTHAAASQLAEARDARGLPETAGIRVFAEPQAEGELAVALTFAAVPAEDDQVTERDGTRVFIAPEVAGPLVDAVVARLRELGASVATGRFGAAMRVSLVNDGPVTFILER